MKKNPRRWTLLGAAIVGLTVAGVLVGQARADQPKRVTGVSRVLDTTRTGNQLGPADGYALAMSTAGGALPAKGTFGPADPVVQQGAQQVIVTAGSQGDRVTTLTQAGDSGITQLQDAVQPLAALNAPANQGIDGVAGALDTAATTFGPQIQPLDKTVKQTADLLRGVEAPPGG